MSVKGLCLREGRGRCHRRVDGGRLTRRGRLRVCRGCFAELEEVFGRKWWSSCRANDAEGERSLRRGKDPVRRGRLGKDSRLLCLWRVSGLLRAVVIGRTLLWVFGLMTIKNVGIVPRQVLAVSCLFGLTTSVVLRAMEMERCSDISSKPIGLRDGKKQVRTGLWTRLPKMEPLLDVATRNCA